MKSLVERLREYSWAGLYPLPWAAEAADRIEELEKALEGLACYTETNNKTKICYFEGKQGDQNFEAAIAVLEKIGNL